MYKVNGIPLDPIYTGKAFWGMKEYIKDMQMAGKNILFIHTGGTPLFFDFLIN
jgi:D-cysteine desulfhydrase